MKVVCNFFFSKKPHEHKDIERKQGLILMSKEKWAIRNKSYTEKTKLILVIISVGGSENVCVKVSDMQQNS